MGQGSKSSTATRRELLLVGILLIAANLRAPFTSLPPLLSLIRSTLGLNNIEIGVLTTLPLLAFALVSPFASMLGRDWGLERSLLAALILIGGGIIIRSLGSEWCLYLGTAIIGVGIAVGNVLLPSLLKRDFPQRIMWLTATYVVSMGAAAAISSALVVPLSQKLNGNWAYTLGAMVLLPAIAIVTWSLQVGGNTKPLDDPSAKSRRSMWRSTLAWQVTLFMGINSFLYYIFIGWLPAILTTRGFSPAEAGSLHALLQIATAAPSVVLVPMCQRMRDQTWPAVLAALLCVLGILGLSLTSEMATLWILFIGLGTGAGVILSLMFMGLRTTNAIQAAALSGMAQSVGYLLASLGPPLFGALHDISHGWTTPMVMCAALASVMIVLGYGAGRAIQIR